MRWSVELLVLQGPTVCSGELRPTRAHVQQWQEEFARGQGVDSVESERSDETDIGGRETS